MSGSTPTDVLNLTVDPADALTIIGDSNRVVLDHFAGPGGWSTGIADLLHAAELVEVGLEWDAAACATRIANGHTGTLRADVAAYPVCPFLGRTVGYIGSPPCQTFSMAGSGTGRDHLALLCTEVRRILLGLDTYDEAMRRLAAAGALDRDLDKREKATLEALLADAVGGEDAEQIEADYRATLDLVDPRNGLILIPARTIRALLDHDGKGPTNLEWVALEQVPPAGLVFDAYAAALRELGFTVVAPVINAADYGVPQTRERKFVIASRVRRVTVPEPTHAKGGEEATIFGPGRLPWPSMARALGWGMDARPYVTVAGGRPDSGGPDPMAVGGTGGRKTIATELEAGRWVARAAGRDNDARRDPATDPSPTIRGNADNVRLEDRLNAGTIADAAWASARPATTVVGSFCPDVVSAPGYRLKVSRQNAPGSLRITEAEGAILQGFPAAYVWEGSSKGKRWEQIGNVVCPPVARRVVAELLGVEAKPLPWHTYAWDGVVATA